MEVSLSMMNELQQAEFALLKAFDQVCAKLGLKYFLVCGSALGAAKYRGFIPWDDDIDVALYREDYEIFCAHAAALLPEHLFVQNYRTDPAFPAIYSKLRDSNTTYIEKSARHLPIHHGIFIDVFPLDGYPDGRLARRRLEFFKRLYKHALAAAFSLDRSGGEQLLYLVDGSLVRPNELRRLPVNIRSGSPGIRPKPVIFFVIMAIGRGSWTMRPGSNTAMACGRYLRDCLSAYLSGMTST